MADIGLEAKALWEKGRREGLPHFGSKSESDFQDFLLAYESVFFFHFQDYRGLSADYRPVDNSHNYYCCLLSNYYVLATMVNSFPV